MQELLDYPKLLPLVAMVGCGFIAVLSIVGGCIRAVVASRAREQTRREIAAYVAEGSMSPEQGERLLAAGKPERSGGCGWGWGSC
ncbi:MAG TPA: hypothetical protein VG797_04215 [Phycisphaerales bacterium]|nr:hypothetical protein [Phycisphaerales bacterium]